MSFRRAFELGISRIALFYLELIDDFVVSEHTTNIAKFMPNNFLSDLQPERVLLSKVLCTSLNAILFVKSFDGKRL